MSIKLIVTDLDGTFFDKDHITVPKRNIEAFRKAHEMGVKTAVASGRPRSLTEGILAELPFLDYLITSNGAVTYDLKKKETVSSRLIENAQAIEIFKILDSYNLPYEIFFEGGCYLSEKCLEKYDNKHIPEHFLKILRDHINVVKSLPELLNGDGVEKINVMSLTIEQRSELEKKISETGPIYITSSIPQNMEMNNYEADKGFAVRSLAGILNIGKESVMCFGDEENDAEMLEFADFSFAMENGSEFAKKSAKFTAKPNYECGVAKAVEQYVLGESV